MKKLKMIVTSVVVLAIVGSAFAFNAKKAGAFCASTTISSNVCGTILSPSKRIGGTATKNYIVDWDGAVCNGAACTGAANFDQD